jgi:hypothetical protein
MRTRLQSLFEGLVPPHRENSEKPLYAVAPLPGYETYFVGRDPEGHACLLVATRVHRRRMLAPVRLENLDAQFELHCHLRREGKTESTGTFSVILCRSSESETIRYFLSVCDAILEMLGEAPSQQELVSAIHRLAAIFQKLQKAPTCPVSGLFAELYLTYRSANPSRVLAAWRLDQNARFDFSEGDVRLDVKGTVGRLRAHIFSYEQCNPPSGTIAVVASLFVERSPVGIPLRSLMTGIEERIGTGTDLVLKLYDVVTTTLGTSLNEGLAAMFDMKLAESSLKVYNLEQVPGIRGPLPLGVSDVRFRSDLSGLSPLDVSSLVEKNPGFHSLLVAQNE